MPEAVAEPTGELIVLDETGDTKTIWDKNVQFEVDRAKKQFQKFKDKGYMAYKVDKKGEKGEEMREFDPEAEKVILAPQMKGG